MGRRLSSPLSTLDSVNDLAKRRWRWPYAECDGMIRVMRVTLLKRLAVGFLAILTPTALFAQGCAMCYQTAAGSGAQFIHALRHGILIMFFFRF